MPNAETRMNGYELLSKMFANVMHALSKNGYDKEASRVQDEIDRMEHRCQDEGRGDSVEFTRILEPDVNMLVERMGGDIKAMPKYALFTEYYLCQRVPVGIVPCEDPARAEAVRTCIRCSYSKNRTMEYNNSVRFYI